MPVCQDANHTFSDNSRILPNATDFDGDATKYGMLIQFHIPALSLLTNGNSSIDWVVDKGNIIKANSSDGALVMILTESNGGTRLSSTRYVHYGTITARGWYILL